MTIETRYYIGEPDNVIINDAALIGARILKISRSGIGFVPIDPDFSPRPSTDTEPAEREFKFYPAIGRVDFINPFSSGDLARGGDGDAETIMIKFRT